MQKLKNKKNISEECEHIMKNTWIYKGNLSAQKNSNILSVLQGIGDENCCELTFTTSEINDTRIISYQYKGEQNNIDTVQTEINELKLNIAQQHLSHYFPTYNVNRVTKEMTEHELKLSVNVNKFSNFMSLAQAVALELDIPTRIYEKNQGFLKGKDVSIQVMGNSKELTKFQNLINNFIVEDVSQKNTSKLRI
jgi:hypothetical protein